jgi:hypothetical protein
VILTKYEHPKNLPLTTGHTALGYHDVLTHPQPTTRKQQNASAHFYNRRYTQLVRSRLKLSKGSKKRPEPKTLMEQQVRQSREE